MALSGTGVGNQKPVVIIGMGPGGLSAAITAAQNGHQVVILENREHFSRVQRISADASTIAFLESLRDPTNEQDNKFFNHQLFKSGTEGTVQVKDLQAFLTRKLQENFKNKVEIRRGTGHKIIGIDPDKQVVRLQKPDGKIDDVAFSHIIAADGARHGATEVLNNSTHNTAYQIHHHLKDLQPRQAEVGTVSLKAKPGVNLPTPPDEEMKFNPSHNKRLLELGWDKPYFPRVYIFRNEENTKFFVSGEVPPMIMNIQDKEVQSRMMEAWGKFMVSVRLGYPEHDVALIKSANPSGDKRKDEKNALKSTVFSLEMRSADKSAVELGQQGAFVLVGDAYKNANFFFKHGMNDAIKDGILAARCIDINTGKFNFEAYAKQHATQEKMLQTRMGFAESQNEMPKIRAQVEKDVAELIKIALQFKTVDIVETLDRLKNLPGPSAENFDALYFQLEVEELQKHTAKSISDKLTATSNKATATPDKRSGLLTHSKDQVSVVKAQKDLGAISNSLQKSFFKFYDTNVKSRTGFHQQLVDKAKNKNRI